MKILIISHMFPSKIIPKHGVFLCREMNYLREFDIGCQFLVPSPWAPWPLTCLKRWEKYGPQNPLTPPDDFIAEKVPYLRPVGMWYRRYEGKAMARGILKQAGSLHRQYHFDVVMGVPMIPDAQAAVVIGRHLELPTAAMAIGSDVMVYPELMPTLKKNLLWTLENLDLAIGVSKTICDKISKTGSCRREPVCVYLGRDTEKFSPAVDKSALRRRLGLSGDSVIGIYVGNLIPEKGVPELAQACGRLIQKYPDFKLVCVGSGVSGQLLSNLNIQAGREVVHLTGQISPDQVPQYLQASDFMIFPSHSEGMPQAVLEAMNCGLPVIATGVGGIPEAVVDMQTGLLIQPRDAQQLENVIGKMIVDKRFREETGNKAFVRVHEIFDARKNAEVLAKALWGLKK